MRLGWVCGEPPWLLVDLRHDEKYAFQARCVKQYMWAEVACWYTDKSALKGWSLERRPYGTLLITPAFGLALTLCIEQRSPNETET